MRSPASGTCTSCSPDSEDAETQYRRALANDEASVGAAHLNTATSRNNLGTALWKLGRLDEAEATRRRALADMEAALGPAHLLLAYPLLRLGGVRMEQGALEEADALLRRADAIARDGWPAQERARVGSRARCSRGARRPPEAVVRDVRAALAQLREGGPIYAPEVKRAERWLAGARG
ncbi:MAG: tetratricopeptide repeat protein [Myxococcales bacterium]|nr:tetratricopeptide repeat protein [Myxococcales bacterium]